jgi:hypothetical protein
MPEHPHEPLPRGALLGPEHAAQVGEHEQLVREAVLAKGSAAHLPAPGASRERRFQRARHLAVETAGQAERVRAETQQPLGRLSEQPFPAPVHQSEAAAGVEGEHGDVDLLDDAAEQRGGLERAEPLGPQRVAQQVDLEQREAEAVAWRSRS